MKLNFYQPSFLKGTTMDNVKNLRPFFPIFILFFLGLFSCTHKIATDKLPTTQIIFGRGGGFTGQMHEYTLLEDGRIVEMHSDKPMNEVVKKITKEQATSFYAAVDSMPSKTWLYNVPGNIYHHITVKKEGKKDKKIVWDGGKNDTSVPTYVLSFYKSLRAEVPRRKHHEDNN